MPSSKSDLLTDLSNDFGQLLTAGESYDVIIYAGGEESSEQKEFRAHSIVLRFRSSHFRNALSHDRIQKDGNCMVLFEPNVSPGVFGLVLKYIYSGMVDLENQEGPEILKLLVAAEELSFHKLSVYVQDFLIQEKTEWLRQDPVQILELVFQNHACKSLRDYCLSAICQDPGLLFESENFLNIDESMLILLLRRDDLAMEEIEIWEHLLKWGLAQNSMLDDDASTWSYEDFAKLEAALHQCIPLVRWFQISPSEFSRKVRPFKVILPEGLYEDILTHHLDIATQLESTVLPPRVPLFDSNIIDPKIAALLSSWIDCKKGKDAIYKVQKNPYDFYLLYRGSRDGYNHTAFHRKCDNKGSTVIVAKASDSSLVVGGYNPLDWGLYGYQHTKTSFIFALGKDVDSAKIARVTNPGNAVFCDAGSGPTFGDGPDFVLSAKQWSSSSSCYPKIHDGNTFIVEDYEVFQVKKKSERHAR